MIFFIPVSLERGAVFSRKEALNTYLMSERSLIRQSILENSGCSETRGTVCTALTCFGQASSE